MTDAEQAAFESEVESHIQRYNGLQSSLIRDSLVWLREHEPSLGLAKPIDKELYINYIVKKARPLSELVKQ